MDKSHEKKEYILAGLSERGRLVGVPQQRRVEAVFSVWKQTQLHGGKSEVNFQSIPWRMPALTALSDDRISIVTWVVPRSFVPNHCD